jgi:hypothetical protein
MVMAADQLILVLSVKITNIYLLRPPNCEG